MAPAVAFKSPGTLKLVTPPITKFVPSCKLNCCTIQSVPSMTPLVLRSRNFWTTTFSVFVNPPICNRSEEHTSELQSLRHLVCRLLLEKKKTLHLLQRSRSTLTTPSRLPAYARS